MKVVLRVKARADLDQIFAYSLMEYGEAAAKRYMADIGTALDRLAIYPQLGMPEPRLGIDTRSYPAREHRIIYRIVDDRISIGRVLYKRMDPRRRM